MIKYPLQIRWCSEEILESFHLEEYPYKVILRGVDEPQKLITWCMENDMEHIIKEYLISNDGSADSLFKYIADVVYFKDPDDAVRFKLTHFNK